MRLYQQCQTYARLMRWDKPVGVWLLFFPCIWGLGLALFDPTGNVADYPVYAALFFIGSFLMRSAGCVYNDLCDRDLDRAVLRTKNRPLASGEISPFAAKILIGVLLVLSAGVLLDMNHAAQIAALLSLIPVVIYPWMKRITFWPQIFLGITFNWGVWVGFFALSQTVPWVLILLYVAAMVWTLAYDTIYALQDIDDDLKIGIKSSAIAVGNSLKPFLAACYAAMLVMLSVVGVLMGFSAVYFIHLIVVLVMCFWQVATLDRSNPQNALKRFKNNVWVGAAIGIAFLTEYIAQFYG